MEKIFVLVILIMCNCAIVSAQDTLVLHPAVGKIIDNETKKDYLLFPEIKDSTFQNCIISKSEGKFFVTTRFIDDSFITKEVERSTLEQYHENINRLLEYYTNKAKSDSIKKVGGSSSKTNSNYDQSKMNKDLAAPSMNQKMKDEIRRDARLKADAQRMSDYQKGLGPGPVNIELFKK